MARAVSVSMPSALGLLAPKAQREWARPLSKWPPKLRRTVRLQRTRLPKPLSSWPRIVPVSFMGQSLPLMEGALPFEVCGRHDIQSAHWRPYEKHCTGAEGTTIDHVYGVPSTAWQHTGT